MEAVTHLFHVPPSPKTYLETPWGTEEVGPNTGAQLFAWFHYRVGHRYTITGLDTGDFHVVCECGMESRKDGVDFPR